MSLRPVTAKQSPRPWRPPLQMYLTCVLLVVAAVVGTVLQREGSRSVDEAIARTQSAVEFRAQLAANDIDDAIELIKATLSRAAANPAVADLFAPGVTGCEFTFTPIGPFSAGHVDIVDLNGVVRCSSRAVAETAVYASSDWLRTTGETPVVSQPILDRATGERVLVVAASVPGQGVLATFLDLDTLAPSLSKRLSGPVDASFALVAPESDAIPLARGGSGLLEATAYVSSIGWDVRAWSAGSPSITAAETVNERTRWVLLGATAFLLIALQLLAAVVSRPLRRLSSTIRELTAGDPTVKVAASGPAEVVSVAADFALLMRTVERERRQRERAEADRAAAEAEREAQVAIMNGILRSTQSMIYVKDLDGHYLMVNASFERAVGKAQADIIGQTAASMGPAIVDQWAEGDLLAQEGIVNCTEQVEAADGTHHVDTVKFPLHDAKGALYATCGVSLDVTARHRATEAIAEARDAALAATAAKSMFLAAMSHEMRTPMTAVIGMTDLLAQTDLSPYQRELIDTVQTSGDALLGVINNVLDLSKIESGELHLEESPFDLRTEVERCLDLVSGTAAKKDLDVVCYIDASAPRLLGDATRVGQIATNLLANAVKFTERGEVLIEVTTHPAEDGQLAVTLTVTDSGIGIPPESLGKLFASFSQVDASTTRTYGGTGLGLAIARRLAQAMGGDIVVSSTPGVGSSFTATVVLSADDADPATSSSEPAPDLRGRRLLVVDDNPTSLRILGRQLAQLGVDATLAPTASTAIALYEEAPGFDAVLIDMQMPGTSGGALGAALRHLPGSSAPSPFVLMTDLGLEAADTKGVFDAVLAKPVKIASLREVVAAVLTGASGPRRFRGEAPAAAGARAPLHVLLAEDHPVNQRVVELMLHQLGHTVDIVGDGGAAVRAAATGGYDVVLMDLQMPLMDGLEATRLLRAAAGDGDRPRIIAMTASTLLDDRNACAAAGMDAYLSKPVRAAELDAMLELTTRALNDDAAAGSPAAHEYVGQPVAGPADLDPATSEVAQPDSASEPSPDSATGAGAAPPFDATALYEVLDRLDAGGTGLRDELIRDYLHEGAMLIERLMFAAMNGDHTALARAAHALRSPSTILGASGLADLLYGAEQGSADRTAAEMTPLAVEIVREYGAVSDALRSIATGAPRRSQGAYSS